MDALWTAADIASATAGNATGDWVASGVSIDSRSVATGDLFVALKGRVSTGTVSYLLRSRPERRAH